MTKIFSADFVSDISAKAKKSIRLRQHFNIHQNYQEACQRLINAIELGSYIRPHRHALDPREELLIAVRGRMAYIEFSDRGEVKDVQIFGTERYGVAMSIGLEINPEAWHTVVALEPGSMLLEVKAGPFDPDKPKELAPWAPEESSDKASSYMAQLLAFVGD